ncbi:CgeB family protein [Zobellia barbeyronii]|uniref:Glycosyltransferase family 1 protein n=1 Tax=Zobellia barbeyronii TaxID=2748009 RepID=A0ABS5W8T9_9FLAO|nr:glycosyltransferase [Zobellia barbeyronii]MBT2159747.1 glycosyltransferase family 1 protein [Zobellia barbeyronii]
MRILSVGWFRKTSNTSFHRHEALKKHSTYIDKVEAGPTSLSLAYRIAFRSFQMGLPVKLPDQMDVNKKIRTLITQNGYDIVWIDKGLTVDASTLLFIKKKLPNAKIVSFSPDNMALRHNQSQNYLESIPFYDYTFTTKSFILNDLMNLGAKNVNFIHKTYSENFHYPRKISNKEKERLAADVGFVGVWEKERCDSIIYLIKNGVKVKVFGDGKWNEYQDKYDNLTILPGLFSEDYPKALQTFKISLCFLRKMNYDQQTARTMEIPACGGFMVAERTEEHLELFKEGKEALFFSSNEELLEICKYYLSNEEERKNISNAGLKRCQASGYSNEKTVEKMLNIVLGLK